MVAAGIFNPVTGRRFVKTWKAELLFPFAKITYQHLENILNCSFYKEKSILKYFKDATTENDWIYKNEQNEYAKYKSPLLINPALKSNPYGGLQIEQSGYVDIPIFLYHFKNFLIAKKYYYPDTFNYKDIIIEGDFIKWKSIITKKIIFCEGHHALTNPYFDWLPFNLVKGEILTIKAPKLNIHQIINTGIFIMPVEKDVYKVGSTYTWNYINDEPTTVGRDEIRSKLEHIISCEYKIIDHQSGIRPTVKDRRPLAGMHPNQKNIAIFNGLGTKGVSIAPYFANQFAEYLINGIQFDDEININRFL